LPQSRIELRNQSTEIPRAVLAQVADPSTAGSPTPGVSPTDNPPTSEATPGTTPATGNTQPLETPATGQTREPGANPTGTPRNPAERQDPNNVEDAGAGVPGGVRPTLQIGTLTVDQSGTGRMQHVVESVRVQDVVGQAIVIYSQNGNQQATLPPNLNANADPLAGTDPTIRGRSQAAQTNGATGGAQRDTLNVNRRNVQANTNAVNGVNGNTAIAGGVIRLMDERLPNTTAAGSADQTLPAPQSPTDTQRVPQNSAVPGEAGQPQVR
jgi:hypothetical protein